MKKKFFSVLVTLISIALIATTVLASGSPPGGGWWSAEVIQNVSGGDAHVSIVAYDSASSSTYTTAQATVTTGQSKVFLPADFASLPTNFSGSGVVTADAEVRGMVNMTNRLAGANGIAGGLAAGQYQATASGETSVKFPLAKNNYFGKTTTYYVQNAGDVASTLTATFYANGSTFTYSTPTPVDPYRMVAISPADASMPSGNTLGLGSMVVTSNPPVALAGVIMEYLVTDNPATLLQSTRGFAPSEASNKIYVPNIKNTYFDRFTGLQVQNAGTSPITITVTYKGAGACNAVDVKKNIQPNASGTFVTLPGQTNLPSGCAASAVVDATGPVLGVVNESFVAAFLAANPTRKQESTTYSAFPASSVSQKVSVPIFKEDSSSKATALVIQNVGLVAATNVVMTFVNSTDGSTYISTAKTIQPGASLVVLDARNKGAAYWSGTAMTPALLGCDVNGFNCTKGLFGVTITADQPIVALASETTYPISAPRVSQDKSNYEGFNLP